LNEYYSKMAKVKTLFFAIGLLTLSLPAAATQSCGGDVGWASREFTGSVQSGDTFSHKAGTGTLLLAPARHGWQIQMLENGQPIPVFSPPLRPIETNATNIAGWHFRNRDNTGPNTGDVNAPQHLRRFAFGSMASNVSQNPELLSPARQEGFGGLGELIIEELTLTAPQPGERASINEMRFTVCLVWQGGGDRLAPIAQADPGIAFQTLIAEMTECGLDTSVFRLSDHAAGWREGYQQPFLTPDMDGDNIPDRVVPVTRLQDSASGLAICLLGDNTLKLTPFDGRIGQFFDPQNFVVADGWNIFRKADVTASETSGPPPTLTGDAIDIFKEPSWRALIYLDNAGNINSYWYGAAR
jgi:hypothetical protein